MIARKVSIDALQAAAGKAGVTFQYTPKRQNRKPNRLRDAIHDLCNSEDLGSFRFRLKPIGDTYRAWSPPGIGRPTPHRKNAVCWHGHCDFFRTLFWFYPNCTIKTVGITYRGSADFGLEYTQVSINEECKC